MFIYLLVILLIFLFKTNTLSIRDKELRNKREVLYLKIVCWILVLLAALRGSSVGTDTIAYIGDYYKNTPYYSFSDVFVIHNEVPGYYLLSKICSVLHLPIQFVFFIVEGLYVYSIFKFIKRYSTDALYSIACFALIGLYAISMAALKQTLSMSFVLFYFLALQDKSYIKATVLAVVAFFCHPASLIFLFGVVFYLIRNLKFYYLILIIFIFICGTSTTSIWSWLVNMLESDHYAIYESDDILYTSSTLVFYGVLLFLVFLSSKSYMKQEKEESRIMLGISSLSFAFQFIASISSTAFRLAYFFLPFMIVAFPNSFNRITNVNNKRIMKFVVFFAILFFFVYSNRNGGSVVPYKFFWQVWSLNR